MLRFEREKLPLYPRGTLSEAEKKSPGTSSLITDMIDGKGSKD